MKTEFSVKHFGPIARADISLRPLTVLVGPSNTGKTYLATLIYALHRAFDGFQQLPFFNRFWDGLAFVPSYIPYFGESEFNQEDETFLDNLEGKSSTIGYKNLPPFVHQYISDHIQSEHLGGSLASELARLYDIDSMSEIINASKGTNEASIAVSVYNETSSPLVKDRVLPLWRMNSTINGSILIADVVFDDGLLFVSATESSKQIRAYRRNANEQRRLKLEILAEDFIKRIVPETGRHDSWFLPAARSGIMQSYLVIASGVVGMSTRVKSQTSRTRPSLSGATNDLLSNLLLLSDRRARRDFQHAQRGDSRRYAAVKLIEQAVLKGDIELQYSDENGDPKLVYSPHHLPMNLPLNRSSAMVSELAPLVLYLRDMVNTGDLLVIEEPEAHLHPAAQTEMAKAIARMVRLGVHVVVTTHSDWMIQEWGNLVRRGELTSRGSEGVSMEGGDDWLRAEEVGVWGFKSDMDRGSVVEEIQFDWVEGIDPPEYHEVVEQLYNDTASLFNRHQSTASGNTDDVASNP